jgi:CRISPR-associated exonuclease Cas4
MFTVTDLKQWHYCPRIVYYTYCLPGLRPAPTPKMTLGRAANQTTEAHEHRRTLRAYGLKYGWRAFDLWLESDQLGLCGHLDMLIAIPSNPDQPAEPSVAMPALIAQAAELIPVDYKDSPLPSGAERRRAQYNWQVQLAAYALLVEAIYGRPVNRGFIYYIPARRARQVLITPDLRQAVYDGLAMLADLVGTERYPNPPADRRRCAACEFRRFCNDV